MYQWITMVKKRGVVENNRRGVVVVANESLWGGWGEGNEVGTWMGTKKEAELH